MHNIYSFKITFKRFPQYNINSNDGIFTLLDIQCLNLERKWQADISDHHNIKFDTTCMCRSNFPPNTVFHVRSQFYFYSKVMEFEIQISFYPKAMLGNSGASILLQRFLALGLNNNQEASLLAFRAGKKVQKCAIFGQR